MIECDYCGEEIEEIPCKCDLCGGIFCSEHRIPPKHGCEEIDSWERSINNTDKIGVKKNWSSGSDKSTVKSYSEIKKESKNNVSKYLTVSLLILILITGFGFAVATQIASNVGEVRIFSSNGGGNSVSLGEESVVVSNFSQTRIDPFKDLKYYYSVSEGVVNANFDDSYRHNLEGLYNLLDGIVLREYEKGSEFTCSESSAILEWILEGAGFNAKIATNHDLSKPIENENKVLHSWVIVKFDDGSEVAIESTYLTKDDYFPPGIIMKPNGDYREYSTEWNMYQDWKDKSGEDLDFERWKDSANFDPYSWDPNYYSPDDVKENPKSFIDRDKSDNIRVYISRDNFDWWDTYPYNATGSEFSNWE